MGFIKRKNNEPAKGHVDHRAIRMVDEMMCYFYGLDIKHIKTEVCIVEDRTEMIFEVNTKEIEEKEIEELKRYIKSPRLHELEEYYWGLSGNELSTSNEMALVGMMTDESDIEYNQDTGDLYIKLIRVNQ